MITLLLAACSDPHTDTPPDEPLVDTAEDTGPACHADEDLDGYGDPDAPAPCGGSAVPDATDCDDADASAHPGAAEVCDGADDDCDALVDDADDDLVDGLPFWADADGDGFGGDALVTACSAAAGGLALRDGDCDDADPAVNPDAVEACDGVDRDCDGVAATETGSAAACAADSCADVLAAFGGAAPDGAYWLALASGETAAVWCDMTTDGGGWTLGFVRNTASTGSQGDFGAGNVSLDALGASPETASASSTATLGWADLEALPWDELRLAAYYGGAESYTSRAVTRDALRIPFGSDGYYLYGDAGYYWCGGNASYTDSGVGATDNPAGAPLDCKGHGSLGSGWDFSESPYANQGLTLCGGDGSYWLAATYGGTWLYYGTVGGAQAIWVR